MSVVVERGLARCPRCVAVAKYTFVESGPNSVRYEVHCTKCGEAYSEVNSPVAPYFPGAGRSLVLPAPDVTAVMGARRRRWASTRERVTATITAAAARVTTRDWRRWLHRRPAEPTTPGIRP